MLVLTLLAKEVIRHVAGQPWNEFRVEKLLSSRGARQVWSLLRRRFALIAVVP